MKIQVGRCYLAHRACDPATYFVFEIVARRKEYFIGVKRLDEKEYGPEFYYPAIFGEDGVEINFESMQSGDFSEVFRLYDVSRAKPRWEKT